ncbi:MAG: winged helix-turn-helix domain-containing protein [Halobacteriota archaeon]|nr:winged helix-turn-helix domain-containing protein [Halobacteriota archaeon]
MSIDKNNDMKKIKDEWIEEMLKEGKISDYTEWHRLLWKVMQNKKRRDILAFIGDGKRASEIMEAFSMTSQDAKIHLGMLESALYIERSEKDGEDYFVLTPLSEE